MRSTKTQSGRVVALTLLLMVSLFPVFFVFADPSGASISGVVSETAPNRTPSSRSDARGTITTMLLNSVQQNQHWKAYVGNVTGSLTLDDAMNFTIYDWDLSTITGQVYASRYDNLSWSGVGCASQGLIVNESTFHNMTNSDSDDINSTFNWTAHQAFTVGITSIGANSCNSTATYVNDTRPSSVTAATPFQEILLQDTNGYLVYMTEIENNQYGFDNHTYDFQMIVAESNVKASPTTYYFYVELR